MNSPQLALRVASVCAAFICLGHLVRLIVQTDVTIGVYHIGLWPSGIVFLGSGLLSVWFWRQAQESGNLHSKP